MNCTSHVFGSDVITNVKLTVDEKELTSILWYADFDIGTLKQWESSKYQPTPCGGEFTGAGGFGELSRDLSHSGEWSFKMTIPGVSLQNAPAPGVRLHRWCESQRNNELFYSVWYFVPRFYGQNKGGWLNWFQFKSKRPNKENDPFFFLDIKSNAIAQDMRFLLTWWGGLKIPGPRINDIGHRTWSSIKSIPIGKWFHVEARYVCSGDYLGAIQIWQDGEEIFNLEGVKTRHHDGDCQWGINNYGTGIFPSPVEIYVDDAAISTKRLYPKLIRR